MQIYFVTSIKFSNLSDDKNRIEPYGFEAGTDVGGSHGVLNFFYHLHREYQFY